MDRTFVGNLQQLGSLLVRQRPAKLNIAFDTIEHSFLGFAFGAIGGVDLRMPQMDCHFLERPRFSASVHRHGHGSTCTQSGEQKIVGRRSCIRAAGGYRFVRMQTVRARMNFLRESGSAAAHHYTSNVTFFHKPARIKCSSPTSSHADALTAVPLKNASKSALIWSALVVGMPCGKPL
jgi:hypothetical protein